jgi:hypothetical protein
MNKMNFLKIEKSKLKTALKCLKIENFQRTVMVLIYRKLKK